MHGITYVEAKVAASAAAELAVQHIRTSKLLVERSLP